MATSSIHAVRSEHLSLADTLRLPVVNIALGVLIGLVASVAIIYQQDISSAFRHWQQLENASSALSDIPDGISQKCWLQLLQQVDINESNASRDVTAHATSTQSVATPDCQKYMPTDA